ncbi:hypothetical protein Atep_14370 [Allochromatium tepidum]|uniref:PASTA domain-containing protein n=1 Tax=Allochromatium tepidum TaxID=553982 RepID=A0ABN6G9Z4_9GAMM|nr:hypothetical protein Atep_14370 [Allochromatium tepidum]
MRANAYILSAFALTLLSGLVSAKCLPQPDATPKCRYPAGDSWCAEKDRANPYAYSDQCLAAASSAADVETIRFWNTNKLFANQGQCSAVFFFDSGLQAIENLQVSFSALNASGESIATGTLEIATFGNGSADRYADAFAESEHFCDDDLTIVVDQATAIIEGRKVDLLAQKVLVPEDFKPFKIRTTSARETGKGQSDTLIVVPNPASDCDFSYNETLKNSGLVPKEISIHGPVDDDFSGYGCPYRITPAPGTKVRAGSTVTFRSAWEAG